MESRQEFGHWEIDTVMGRGSKDCVLSLVERKTGLVIIGKLEQYDFAGATAVASVMLLASFILLLIINALQAWGRRRYGGAP